MLCCRHQNRSFDCTDHPLKVMVQMQPAASSRLVVLAQHEQAGVGLQLGDRIHKIAMAHASIHLLHPEGRGARLGARSRRVFDDASLPAHWRDLERRVSNRKLRNLGDGPVGRGRPSKTEADYWLEAGLYDAPGAPRSTPTAASPASGRSLRARPPPRATSSDF